MKKFAVMLIASIAYEAVAAEAIASAVCVRDCEDTKPHVELDNSTFNTSTSVTVTLSFTAPPERPVGMSTFVTALPQQIPLAQSGFINSFNLPLHG